MLSRGESLDLAWSRSRAEAQMAMKAISTQGPTSREYISVSEVFITCNISHLGSEQNTKWNTRQENRITFYKIPESLKSQLSPGCRLSQKVSKNMDYRISLSFVCFTWAILVSSWKNVKWYLLKSPRTLISIPGPASETRVSASPASTASCTQMVARLAAPAYL